MPGNKKLWGPLHDHDLLRPIGNAVKVYGNVNNIKVLGQKQVQYFIPTFLDVNNALSHWAKLWKVFSLTTVVDAPVSISIVPFTPFNGTVIF